MADEIAVKPVKTKKEFEAFLALPEKIYRGCENWVPKLDMDVKHLLSEKNPFYDHAWKELYLAYRNGVPCGRIAAIIDRNYNEFQGENTGFWGFFECENDRNVSQALFAECERALKGQGMTDVMGPMNPSTNDEMGLLVDGYGGPPMIMMPYNLEYYAELVADAGYAKVKDLLAMFMDIEGFDPARLEKFVRKMTARCPEMTCRNIDLGDFKKEVEHVKSIYNDAWFKNWGFVPWTDGQMDDMAKQLRPLAVKELIEIGCVGGKPVGFLLSLPDYNFIIKNIGRKLLPFGWLRFITDKKKIRNIRLMAMGVVKEYQNRGVGALMYYNALIDAKKMGYTGCEFSWILEDNTETLRIGEMMGGRVYRTYRVYSRHI